MVHGRVMEKPCSWMHVSDHLDFDGACYGCKLVVDCDLLFLFKDNNMLGSARMHVAVYGFRDQLARALSFRIGFCLDFQGECMYVCCMHVANYKNNPQVFT